MTAVFVHLLTRSTGTTKNGFRAGLLPWIQCESFLCGSPVCDGGWWPVDLPRGPWCRQRALPPTGQPGEASRGAPRMAKMASDCHASLCPNCTVTVESLPPGQGVNVPTWTTEARSNGVWSLCPECQERAYLFSSLLLPAPLAGPPDVCESPATISKVTRPSSRQRGASGPTPRADQQSCPAELPS